MASFTMLQSCSIYVAIIIKLDDTRVIMGLANGSVTMRVGAVPFSWFIFVKTFLNVFFLWLLSSTPNIKEINLYCLRFNVRLSALFNL